MGIKTGNPTWVGRPDTSTPITAQALNNIEDALDSIGGGGGVFMPGWVSPSSVVGGFLQIMCYGDFAMFGYGGHASLAFVASTPVLVDAACTIDQLVLYVNTGYADTEVVAALYKWPIPGTKTLEKVALLGTIPTASSGTKALTFTPISLEPGYYVVLSYAQGGGNLPVVYGLSGSALAVFQSPDSGNGVKKVWSAYAYGPPYNFFTGDTISLSNDPQYPVVPNISLRRAS